LWADETVYWFAHDEEEIRIAGGTRSEISRREHEAFHRALRDFRRDGVYHVSESTSAIVEAATFSGTTHNGKAVRNPTCIVYTIEDGKIARLDIYSDPTKSLKMAEILVHSLLGDETFGRPR
jgi:ketosteroid isomerase-like protein